MSEAFRMNRRKIYYSVYTLCFLLISAVVLSYYYLNGKTLINQTNDGLIQYYKASIYYSEYLKTVLRNIFIEHSFIIPKWDFSIGEGADILQTLNGYPFGDPLSLLSVFFPKDKIYIWCDLSIILRLYLSGIVFSELCFYTDLQNRYAVLAGSIIYTFSYWSLHNVNEHISFLNPMIYLPLVIFGVEKIIREDKPFFLAFTVFISILCNFYFFYIIVILTVIYVALRLPMKYGKDIRMIIDKLIRIFVYSLIGTMMAATFLFPIMDVYLNNSRGSLERPETLLYSRLYYEMLFSAFVSVDTPFDTEIGLASPTLLALGLLLKDKNRKGRFLLLLNVIAFVMLCLPFVGKLMNGLAYPINRWTFAIVLLAAYSMVYEWDNIGEEGYYLPVFMSVLFATAMISAWNRTLRVFVAIFFCIVFYVVSKFLKDRTIRGVQLKQVLLILIIAANIFYIADYDYSERGLNRIEDAASIADAVNEVLHSDARLMKEYAQSNGEDDFFRYSGNHLQVNSAMLEKVNSTDYYWSFANPYVVSYREKLGLLDYTSYLQRGLDDRTALYALANVKYFLGNDEELIPYGFTKTANQSVYKNEFFVPFGYTYDKSISYDEWNGLDQIAKETALLKYIVLEEGNSKADLKSYRVDYEISGDENTVIEKDRIISKAEKAEVTIKISSDRAGEYSLSLAGISFEDTDGYIEGNRNWVRIRTYNGELRKDIYYLPPEYQFYSGRHDFSVCYGYLEGIGEIKLVLPYPGIYHFDDFYVSCVDYEDYRQDTDNLKKNVLEDVVFEDNHISGKIELKEDKYLLLSIPYAKGWKAYVNGEKAELMRANECYMALKLNKGTNVIELNYDTPYLKVGMAVSVLSAVAFIWLIMKDKKRK